VVHGASELSPQPRSNDRCGDDNRKMARRCPAGRSVEKTWGCIYPVRVKAREHLWELLGIATGLRKTLFGTPTLTAVCGGKFPTGRAGAGRVLVGKPSSGWNSQPPSQARMILDECVLLWLVVIEILCFAYHRCHLRHRGLLAHAPMTFPFRVSFHTYVRSQKASLKSPTKIL